MLKAKAKKAGRRITVGEDKAYDTADHVANLRALNVTPHVVQNDSITATGKRRQSAIDGRTTRHQGYGISQSCRAMTGCIFGWGKQHGTMRKTKQRGIARDERLMGAYVARRRTVAVYWVATALILVCIAAMGILSLPAMR